MRHPEAPRFFQRGEGSRVWLTDKLPASALDPSFRLKNGSTQDDATFEIEIVLRLLSPTCLVAVRLCLYNRESRIFHSPVGCHNYDKQACLRLRTSLYSLLVPGSGTIVGLTQHGYQRQGAADSRFRTHH